MYPLSEALRHFLVATVNTTRGRSSPPENSPSFKDARQQTRVTLVRFCIDNSNFTSVQSIAPVSLKPPAASIHDSKDKYGSCLGISIMNSSHLQPVSFYEDFLFTVAKDAGGFKQPI